MQSSGGIELDLPESTHDPFLVSSVAVGVNTSLDCGSLGELELTLPSPHEALGLLEDGFTSLQMNCASFYPRHITSGSTALWSSRRNPIFVGPGVCRV